MTKETKHIEEKNKIIAVVRIAGEVKKNYYIEEVLSRLRLKRKYSCSLFHPTKEITGMFDKAKHYIAYGEINKETLIKLLKSRAKRIDKKEINAEKSAEELLNNKTLKEIGIKPFFRLHPPRKGIKSKLNYPKGVLGNNKKDINKLIERML